MAPRYDDTTTRIREVRERALDQLALQPGETVFDIACGAGAWVPFISGSLPDILCEQHERTVGNDNCVSFEGLNLQLPADELRHHYVRSRVRVHRYVDATLGVFHGPRKLASYDVTGKSTNPSKEVLRAAA